MSDYAAFARLAHRVLLLALATLVAWFAKVLPIHAITVAVPTTFQPAYTYDSAIIRAHLADAATERGPPDTTALALPVDSRMSAAELGSSGSLARPKPGGADQAFTYDPTPLLVQTMGAHGSSDTVIGEGSEADQLPLRSPERARVAAKGVAGLSDDVVRLSERNITNSGDTVLGHFPGYINKANSRGASYFDIGDAWNGLSDAQRWAANRHFLDTRIAAGDPGPPLGAQD